MLISFIGAPCSGKTTTAAKLFAELKDSGMPSEYIAEKARTYIAEKRYALKQVNQEHLFDLDDSDQQAIARSQFHAEVIMNQPGLFVVTDSSVLNSLLYMSSYKREEPAVKMLATQATQHYDIIFLCACVERSQAEDPNRIHDEVTSHLIQDQITTILNPYVDFKKVVTLTGPSHERLQLAYRTVMEVYTKSC